MESSVRALAAAEECSSEGKFEEAVKLFTDVIESVEKSLDATTTDRLYKTSGSRQQKLLRGLLLNQQEVEEGIVRRGRIGRARAWLLSGSQVNRQTAITDLSKIVIEGQSEADEFELLGDLFASVEEYSECVRYYKQALSMSKLAEGKEALEIKLRDARLGQLERLRSSSDEDSDDIREFGNCASDDDGTDENEEEGGTEKEKDGIPQELRAVERGRRTPRLIDQENGIDECPLESRNAFAMRSTPSTASAELPQGDIGSQCGLHRRTATTNWREKRFPVDGSQAGDEWSERVANRSRTNQSFLLEASSLSMNNRSEDFLASQAAGIAQRHLDLQSIIQRLLHNLRVCLFSCIFSTAPPAALAIVLPNKTGLHTSSLRTSKESSLLPFFVAPFKIMLALYLLFLTTQFLLHNPLTLLFVICSLLTASHLIYLYFLHENLEVGGRSVPGRTAKAPLLISFERAPYLAQAILLLSSILPGALDVYGQLKLASSVRSHPALAVTLLIVGTIAVVARTRNPPRPEAPVSTDDDSSPSPSASCSTSLLFSAGYSSADSSSTSAVRSNFTGTSATTFVDTSTNSSSTDDESRSSVERPCGRHSAAGFPASVIHFLFQVLPLKLLLHLTVISYTCLFEPQQLLVAVAPALVSSANALFKMFPWQEAAHRACVQTCGEIWQAVVREDLLTEDGPLLLFALFHWLSEYWSQPSMFSLTDLRRFLSSALENMEEIGGEAGRRVRRLRRNFLSADLEREVGESIVVLRELLEKSSPHVALAYPALWLRWCPSMAATLILCLTPAYSPLPTLPLALLEIPKSIQLMHLLHTINEANSEAPPNTERAEDADGTHSNIVTSSALDGGEIFDGGSMQSGSRGYHTNRSGYCTNESISCWGGGRSNISRSSENGASNLGGTDSRGRRNTGSSSTTGDRGNASTDGSSGPDSVKTRERSAPSFNGIELLLCDSLLIKVYLNLLLALHQLQQLITVTRVGQATANLVRLALSMRKIFQVSSFLTGGESSAGGDISFNPIGEIVDETAIGISSIRNLSWQLPSLLREAQLPTIENVWSLFRRRRTSETTLQGAGASSNQTQLRE